MITFTRFWIPWPRKWLLILLNEDDTAMSDFSQSESLTHILTGPNIMEMRSAFSGSKYSPHYISIIFAPLHFKCNYICHSLNGFTAWYGVDLAYIKYFCFILERLTYKCIKRDIIFFQNWSGGGHLSKPVVNVTYQMTNYIYMKLWDLLMHLCPNFYGSLAKLTLKSVYG